MAEPKLTAKTKLLADIDRTWAELNAQLGRLSDEQMTKLVDHAGWTVKDHIVHIARWEQSVVFYLQGKPRWAGLGVDEELVKSQHYDDVNAAMQQQNRNLPLAAALQQMRSAHQEMMALLQPLTDADLNRPLKPTYPDEFKGWDDPHLLPMIISNTSGHYSEHMPWIEALVNQAPRPSQGGTTMADSVYKVIELVGTSTESWEKAARFAVDTAAKSLHDLRIAEIEKLDMQIEEGEVVAYRAKVKLSFKYHPEDSKDD